MAKRTKKSAQIERHEVSGPVVYSNQFGIGYSDTEVVIDFGFSTPSYFEPHDEEDIQVARIVLSWEVAAGVGETLKKVLDKHKKALELKRKPKVKAKDVQVNNGS